MATRSAILNVMTAAAIKAGKAVLRDFGELDKLQVSRKGTADFATNADRRSEKTLHQELSKARPTYGFMMEESGEIEGKDPTCRFVIDPIDGTHNFIHAVPYFCISIAMEKRLHNGTFETQAGVIYDPIHNELFCAELYQGATVNDMRLQVSGRTEPDTFMLVTHTLGTSQDDRTTKTNDALRSHPLSLRMTGSLALDLAYVAAGRYDGVCTLSYKHWDIAAGKLLVREAGGQILHQEEPGKTLLFAASPALHGKLATQLRAIG